jgi:hypothetical protein
MESLAERAEARLLDVIARFTAGEAEVVQAFFAREHTTEEYLDALLRQMGRELQTRQRLGRAMQMNEGLERTVDRHDLVEMLEHIADETRHYTLLADVAEGLIGRKLTAEEAMRYEINSMVDPNATPEALRHPLLPEASAMMLLTRELRAREGPAFANAVLRLSEGGGGGAFQVAAELTGSPFREQLAAAMLLIVRDELGHGPGRVRGFVEQSVQDEATLERAEALLAEYMWQHLRLRNEIWGNPLPEERLAAIRRGEIAPLAVGAAATAH